MKSFSWVLINELSVGTYPKDINDLNFLKKKELKVY